MKKFIIIVIVLCCTILSSFATSDYQYQQINNINNNQNIDASVIYKQTLPSMLYIETNNGTGSGVILDKNGTFVTCFHVIAEADYIKVKTSTNEEYYVNGFKYINPLDDVAILTLNKPNKLFQPIEIPQNIPNVGDKVYTLSNPRGLQFSFSDGMISNISKDYIQFTAPISPGSSGGALLSSNGKLLGIITSYLRNEAAQNINFSLPNEYYMSKLNNVTVKNIHNNKWQDFVFNNASEDQFKLTLQYALNEQNKNLLYKYLKPYTYRSDFPVNLLPTVAYFAAYSAFYNEDITALDDAIYWYEKALKNPTTEEVSAFALPYLYIFSSKRDSLTKKEVKQIFKIIAKYPESNEIYSNLIKRKISPDNFSENYWYYLYYLTYKNEYRQY